jgi:hypothetical protein
MSNKIINHGYDFYEACQDGQLSVAQSIYQNYSTLIINNSTNNVVHIEGAFQMVCWRGCLEFAQWLYQIKPAIDISANNSTAFRLACSAGHLDIAQWLYKIKPIINDEAFLYACVGGHLHVAKWLYQLKPTIDILVNNDEAFRHACINGPCWNGPACMAGEVHLYVAIAKWLVSIRPYRYEIIKLNVKYMNVKYRIKTIEEAKEARWQHIKYAVWAASNSSRNHDSLLYKLPPDVSRLVFQFV